jgi:membrane protein implicated in regulation of membrane protease activity
VPILPLIDLMILIAWTCLIVAVVQKALWMALATQTSVFGMTPYDFVLVSGVSLLFALALAARVWVKANESRLLSGQRAPGPLGEVLPDFPDPRGRGAKPGRETPGGGEAPDQVATG